MAVTLPAMLTRRIAPLLIAPLLLVACGGDDGGDSDGVGGATVSDNGSSDNGSSDNGNGGVVVGGVTPAPALGPLAMPAAQAAVLSPDPAAGLAALGFPEGWLLPESAVSIIGVHVGYSRGDDTYTTFRTSYEVGGDDPEAVLDDWREAFVAALDVDVDKFSVHASSELGEAWLVSSIGSAEPGQPKLQLEVAQLADGRPLVLTVEYVTLDRAFPEVTYPAEELDPTLPSLDSCTPRRIDITIDPEVDVTSAPKAPAYRLWFEGQCDESIIDGAAAWANGHGRDIDAATADSVGHEALLDDGTTVSLNASLLDDGGTFFSLVIEQPLA